MTNQPPIIPRTGTVAAAMAICAGLLAAPAAAVDGEILINQARVNAGGITPGDTAGFPATLSRPGRYKLSSNLAVPVGVDGIVVKAHDVTIDLNGFTISSFPPGQARVGVFAANTVTGLRVMNGTITGFDLHGIAGGTRGRVDHMRIVSNRLGVDFKAGSHIRDSTLANNVDVGALCSACVIERNVITGNGASGIAEAEGKGGLVLGNVIASNGFYGLAFSGSLGGYGNNILFGNNAGGLQVLNAAPAHPNFCVPACP
jgi:hypothetical protein